MAGFYKPDQKDAIIYDLMNELEISLSIRKSHLIRQGEDDRDIAQDLREPMAILDNARRFMQVQK